MLSVSGRVRIAGSTPMEQVLIEPEDDPGAGWEVKGKYRDELLRLSGARVRAVGTRSGRRGLEVREYEILEIAGATPLVGVLERTDTVLRLRPPAGEPVTLGEVPEGLESQAGAKVWVILDASGAIRAYGILRER